MKNRVAVSDAAGGHSLHLTCMAAICHGVAVLLLIWTVSVPLEQALWQSRHPETTVVHHEKSISEDIRHSGTLIRIAAAVMLISGCLLWRIQHRISRFKTAFGHALDRIRSGDPDAALGASKGFEALADDFNRLTAYHRLVERRLIRSGRLMAAIIVCYREMISDIHPDRWYQRVTDALVGTGEYPLAWWGFLPENGALVIKAWSGPEREETIPDFWMDSECSPVRRAIRNRRPAVLRDIIGDPCAASWRNDARHLGYDSVISLPLVHHQDGVTGVLTVYVPPSRMVDIEEIQLLTEFVNDLTLREPGTTAG